MDLAAEWERVRTTPSDIVDHLDYMVSLVLDLNAKNVIELGVRHGTSTIAWLHGLVVTGGHLWSVDIDPTPDWLQHDRWTFVRGSDLHPDVLADLPRYVDIAFIDTTHHYMHTRFELETCRTLVRAGGVIVCHDTEVERPYRAPAVDPPFPVRQAIHEFCARWGVDLEINPACNGLATIYM